VSGELIDHDRLVAWLDDQGLETGAPLVVEQISGGASNVMFRLERGDSRWVLRRPARVAIERANDGMRREFRLISAFEGTPVPHPAPVALCDDHAVLGCTFYLMACVDGINPLPVPEWLDDPAGRAELTFALTDAMARMHEVDPVAAGIADLGRPDDFHERQVSRWTRQLESYDGRELPGLDRVTTWLDANRPASFVPSIMHGDYHMMNVMIAPDAPARVVAIVDWETATIGDPLLDLAGFYEIWTLSTGEGWPTSEEIAARYAETRGIADLGDLTYYAVLYNFRLAVLLEGIYQRSSKDPTRPTSDALGDRVFYNIGRAVELIDAKG
jgi:aminoglycoside phosphotransferase (APT) family kinase protein